MVDMCQNQDCSDPVEGTPLQCQVARSNAEFCGIKGVRYKEKSKEPKPESKVIELV